MQRGPLGRPGADHPARGPGQNRYHPVSEKKAEDADYLLCTKDPSRKPWGRRRALPGAWGCAHQDPRRREETAATATLRSQQHWGSEKAWTCTPSSGCPWRGSSSFSRRRHDLTVPAEWSWGQPPAGGSVCPVRRRDSPLGLAGCSITLSTSSLSPRL